MGNKIGVEINPQDFGDFLSNIKENESKANQEIKNVSYRNIIRIWEFKLDTKDEFSVVSNPMNLQEESTFSETSSYLLLHTCLKSGNILKSPLKIENNNNQQPSIESFIQTTKSVISPRGQTTVYAGYHSNNVSQKKIKSKLIHDIYLWNGNKVPQLIKAVASSKVLELENLISEITLSYLLSYHSSPNIAAISKNYSDLVIDSTTKKQLSFNHLFALITKQNLPAELKAKRETKTHRSSASVRDLRTEKKAHRIASVNSDEVRVKRKDSIRRKSKAQENENETQTTTITQTPLSSSSFSSSQFEIKKKELPKDHKEKKINYRSISLPSKQISQVKARLKLGENNGLFIDVTQISEGLRDVSRPPSQERIKRLDKICSKINENLFLGSDTIAQDKEELQKNGITHILNCAGAVCAEYHSNSNSFIYKTLFLTDGKTEDISCVFYDVLEFMDDAIKDGGKVFVHCHQGISRSSSMVILYEMWKNKTPFAETHEKVKRNREVSNPNQGFMCQLMNWWNRISQPMLTPRCYHVVPHCVNTPHLFVLKLFEGDNLSSFLDSRGCFIIHDIGTLFLWKGRDSLPISFHWANIYIGRLQRFEKAPSIVKIEDQGDESSEFKFIMGSNLNSVGRRPENDDVYALTQIAQNSENSDHQIAEVDVKKSKKDKSRKKKLQLSMDKSNKKHSSLLNF